MNKYKTLLKDTSIFAIGSIASKAIIFFLVPLYTNYLSTEEYGIADLVFTMAQMLIPFVSLVIFDGVIRFGLMYKERTQDVLLVGLIVWGAGCSVTIFLTPLFAKYSSIGVWSLYLCVYVCVNVLLSIELNYLKVLNKNMDYAIISIIQTVALAVLNIYFLVIKQWKIEGYLMANIISQIIAIIFASIFCDLIKELKKAKLDKKIAKEMITYSSPLILNNLSWWIIQSSDKVMIEAMVGAAELGLYTVACKIPSLISVFVAVFQQAWGISSIKEMDSGNETEFYSIVFQYFFFFIGILCLGIIVIVRPFMVIYAHGNGYEEAWRLVPMLLASALFSAIAAYYGGMYGALKKSINNMISTAVAAIVNIGVNLLCIRWIGVFGAVTGTFVSYLILALMRMVDVNKYVHIDVKKKLFLLNLVLIITDSILITVNFHIYFVSVVSFVAFLLINQKLLIDILRKLWEHNEILKRKNK